MELRDPPALRGEEYRRTITIQNQFDTATLVTTEPLGSIEGWLRSEPPSGFTVPPRSNQAMNVVVQVPLDAANGDYTGFLRVVAEPKERVDGSGFALRYAVAVVVNVTVSGEEVRRAALTEARADCIELGSPAQVFAKLQNTGNVRVRPRVTAQVTNLAGAPVAQGEAQPEVLPAPATEVPIPLSASLSLGEYDVRVAATLDGQPLGEHTLRFKVVNVGECGKEGLLRFLQHEPWVEAGFPVKVTAVFENVGKALISKAKFTGEVYLGGKLVAVLSSDELVVPVGRVANLSAFFTPTQPGVHTIVGKVLYDGFETPDSESLLNVQGGQEPGAGLSLPALPGPPWLPFALPLVLALPLLLFLLRRRRKRRGQGPRS